jgi:hypothetical protein
MLVLGHVCKDFLRPIFLAKSLVAKTLVGFLQRGQETGSDVCFFVRDGSGFIVTSVFKQVGDEFVRWVTPHGYKYVRIEDSSVAV